MEAGKDRRNHAALRDQGNSDTLADKKESPKFDDNAADRSVADYTASAAR